MTQEFLMMTQAFQSELLAWAAEPENGVQALLVVGSCARGTARPDSDIDLVILTTRKAELLRAETFPARFGRVLRQQREEYGACTSVRAWYDGGPEVEFGLVAPSWIDRPLDAGTHRVLLDGYRVLYDPQGLFRDLVL